MKLQYKILLTLLITATASAQRYQIGSKWNRYFIGDAPNHYKSFAQSVGEIGSTATLFYIGKIKDKHYAITNFHVCPDNQKCKNKIIEFFYHKNRRGSSLKGRVKKVTLAKKQLDLSLLELQFSNLSSFEKAPRPLQLSNSLPKKNTALFILGYGINENEYGSLTIGHSKECRVFSNDNEIKKIEDPDSTNTVNYKVYSFLVGCEASHGDSGAPIFEKRSGKVIGLLWTGKIPKRKIIKDDDFQYLPLKILWTQLTYASPAKYIKQELKKYFNTL